MTPKETKAIISDIANIKYHMDVLNTETGELRDLVKDIVANQNRNQSANAECIQTIKINQEGMKTDLEWLKRAFFIVATSSIGAVIASVFNLLEKR